MNRLIKAEAFRLRQHVLRLLVFSVTCGLIPVISSINVWGEDLGKQIEGSGITIMAVLMIFPAIFAETTGLLYEQGRLGFNEIMAGNKTPRIVFSKIATDGLLYLGLTVLTTCGYYVCVGVSRGVGSFDHALIRLLLILMVLARLAFCSTLIAIAIRIGKSGAMAACFLRFWVLDIGILPFLSWLVGRVIGWEGLAIHFSYASLTNQLMILVSEPLHVRIVLHVLLGFAVEFALWYAVIDMEMRKRKIA